MHFSFDRTGFPLIRLPRVGLDVHLLPVAKVQFERFIAEPHGFGDGWYEGILALNPRVSYRQFSDGDREGVLITGLLPEEALSFARWLGDGWVLPTTEQWRAIYAALESAETEPDEWEALRSQCRAPQARTILTQLMDQLKPRTWARLSLMHGGLVEWVRQDNGWVGVGTPRSVFYPNLWDPAADVVSPLRAAARLPYFGFRLVRSVM